MSLGDILNRVVNPTNAMGQFGQALLASGGDLGGAAGILLKLNNDRANRAGELENWKAQYDYERANPKPSTAAPHYWESNDGSLHVIGQDGAPREVYHDPSPKMNFIPDGMGGGQWVAVPTAASSMPMGAVPGALAPSSPQMPAIGSVMADPRKAGGGSGNAAGGFLGF